MEYLCGQCNPLTKAFCSEKNICAASNDDKIDALHLPPGVALLYRRDGKISGSTNITPTRFSETSVKGTGMTNDENHEKIQIKKNREAQIYRFRPDGEAVGP